MPLLCKGCGQPLAVPDASTDEPEPPPLPPPVVPPPKKKPTPLPPPPPKAEQPADAGRSPRLIPDVEPEPSRKNPVSIVVDVVVGLILLAIGVVLGEMLTQKPTGQVLHEAGTAMKFPPVDLIMWMSPPSVILLTYGLFVSKGRGVGNWLKRRATRSLP